MTFVFFGKLNILEYFTLSTVYVLTFECYPALFLINTIYMRTCVFFLYSIKSSGKRNTVKYDCHTIVRLCDK